MDGDVINIISLFCLQHECLAVKKINEFTLIRKRNELIAILCDLKFRQTV